MFLCHSLLHSLRRERRWREGGEGEESGRKRREGEEDNGELREGVEMSKQVRGQCLDWPWKTIVILLCNPV